MNYFLVICLIGLFLQISFAIHWVYLSIQLYPILSFHLESFSTKWYDVSWKYCHFSVHHFIFSIHLFMMPELQFLAFVYSKVHSFFEFLIDFFDWSLVISWFSNQNQFVLWFIRISIFSYFLSTLFIIEIDFQFAIEVFELTFEDLSFNHCSSLKILKVF